MQIQFLLKKYSFSRIPLIFLLTAGLAAHPLSAETKKRKLWKASVAILISASAADAMSSWNRPEANGLLRGPGGRFSGRGLALKSALVAGTILGQHLMLRKNPAAEKTAAWTNFALAGALGGVAAYNWKLQSGARYAPGTPAR